MPKEKPIIPQGMPNPIGPPVIEGVRNKARRGGEMPMERYPLVSRIPPCSSGQRARQVTLGEWQNLHDILITGGMENQPEKTDLDRMEELRKKSEELKGGWELDTLEYRAKRLEMMLNDDKQKKEAEEKAENDRIEKKKAQERADKEAKIKEFLKRKDERYQDLEKAVLLSEVKIEIFSVA